MPENNTGSFIEILKYGWVLLIGALTWMWQKLVAKVDANTAALIEHEKMDIKAHEEFVTHTYVQDEIKPWLNRIDQKMDTLVNQTADVIKREEYKKDIGNLYASVSAINAVIAGIKGKLEK